MTKRIPIKAAKEVSLKYDWPEIVIFGYDPKTGLQHVTTFGVSVDQCVDAAKAGNYLKKSLGWPENQCQAQAARVKKEKKNDH